MKWIETISIIGGAASPESKAMKEVDKDEMQQFLLGRLDEVRRQRVEELFMVNPEYREELLMTENDLIENYLEGNLSNVDEEMFRAHFLSTEQQRRKLNIAKSLKKYAITESAARSTQSETATEQNPKRRGYFKSLTLRNSLLYLPLAAALMIAIIVGVNWVVENKRLNEQRAREQSRDAALARELAQLNDPANNRATAENQDVSAVLPPISARGASGPVRLSPTADVKSLTLRLVLMDDESQSYRAILQKVGGAKRFTLPPLHAEDTPDGKAVQIKIPAHLMARGLYRLELTGMAADGKAVTSAEYSFSLVDSKTP